MLRVDLKEKKTTHFLSYMCSHTKKLADTLLNLDVHRTCFD